MSFLKYYFFTSSQIRREFSVKRNINNTQITHFFIFVPSKNQMTKFRTSMYRERQLFSLISEPSSVWEYPLQADSEGKKRQEGVSELGCVTHTLTRARNTHNSIVKVGKWGNWQLLIFSKKSILHSCKIGNINYGLWHKVTTLILYFKAVNI